MLPKIGLTWPSLNGSSTSAACRRWQCWPSCWVLSLAVLVQFWDSEHRQLVAWLLVGGWLLIWGLGLWRLLAAVRQLSSPFRLTRRELRADWQAWKERI